MKILRSRVCAFVAICLLLTGCPRIAGVIYHDGNRSSVSEYVQGMDSSDLALPGVRVSLLDGSTESYTLTDGEGAFIFDYVEPGTYILDMDIPSSYDCTSNNKTQRIPDAIREGEVHIVAIGDSIGTIGSEMLYPERLANHFSEMVETSFENLAVSASTSEDWLPGAETGYFEERVVPALSQADLLVITLGGNDVLLSLLWGADLEEIMFLLRDRVIPNLTALIEEVRTINPHCDIVYVIYPNIANSSYAVDFVGEMQQFFSIVFKVVLQVTREELSGIQGIILADLLGALGDTWLDPYQSDLLHPNDEGHQLYADTIFRSLGGVVIDESDIETWVSQRNFGFFTPDHISY